MSESQVFTFAKAIALADGHPDPEAYAAKVEGFFTGTPAEPAPEPEPVPQADLPEPAAA